MKQKIILSAFLTLTLLSCNKLDIPDALTFSNHIVELCKNEEWEGVWETSSRTMQANLTQEKYAHMTDWFEHELGEIKSYKQTYFYTGSGFQIKGGFYIQTHYNITCEKGIAELELRIVKINDTYKVIDFDISKKPFLPEDDR